MEELLRQARLVLRGMWLHRWLGLLLAWAVGLAAGVAVFVMPDRYEASARVFVDTDSVLRPLLAGLAIPANTEQQIAMLSRTLISRPNVEKLIRMADLDLGISSPREREALIERVTNSLSIKSVGRDNLYTLSYQGHSPDQALKVVQALMTIFVESSLGDSRSDSDSAQAGRTVAPCRGAAPGGFTGGQADAADREHRLVRAAHGHRCRVEREAELVVEAGRLVHDQVDSNQFNCTQSILGRAPSFLSLWAGGRGRPAAPRRA